MRKPSDPKTTLFEGKHIRMVSRGKWEYAERKNVTGIVAIVAVTDKGKLLLIEQYRPPVGKYVIELPAGLAGDVAGQESEEMASAARRELFEETGYEAAEMTFVADGTASAGIVDEVISLFVATGLKKTGDGAGDGGEELTQHEVPVGKVVQWLKERKREGKLVDLKVYGALYFAQGGRSKSRSKPKSKVKSKQ
jgi:ADP-ribose pyrophosphatase